MKKNTILIIVTSIMLVDCAVKGGRLCNYKGASKALCQRCSVHIKSVTIEQCCNDPLKYSECKELTEVNENNNILGLIKRSYKPKSPQTKLNLDNFLNGGMGKYDDFLVKSGEQNMQHRLQENWNQLENMWRNYVNTKNSLEMSHSNAPDVAAVLNHDGSVLDINGMAIPTKRGANQLSGTYNRVWWRNRKKRPTENNNVFRNYNRIWWRNNGK